MATPSPLVSVAELTTAVSPDTDTLDEISNARLEGDDQCESFIEGYCKYERELILFDF